MNNFILQYNTHLCNVISESFMNFDAICKIKKELLSEKQKNDLKNQIQLHKRLVITFNEVISTIKDLIIDNKLEEDQELIDSFSENFLPINSEDLYRDYESILQNSMFLASACDALFYHEDHFFLYFTNDCTPRKDIRLRKEVTTLLEKCETIITNKYFYSENYAEKVRKEIAMLRELMKDDVFGFNIFEAKRIKATKINSFENEVKYYYIILKELLISINNVLYSNYYPRNKFLLSLPRNEN